jgi:hypothetical protein
MFKSLIFLCLCAFSACSVWKSSPVLPSNDSQPFSIELHDEAYNNGSLRVTGKVTGDVPWNPRLVSLKITGYSKGVPVMEKTLTITELVGTTSIVPQGTAVEVPLALEAADLSDYQVALIWGQDNTPTAAAKTAAVENIRTTPSQTDCDAPPCPTTFLIECDVVNNTSELLTSVTLGVGYVWQEDGKRTDLSASAPDNSKLDEVPVSPLNLAPGERKAVRLNLTTPVPSTQGGLYVPIVKVLN